MRSTNGNHSIVQRDRTWRQRLVQGRESAHWMRGDFKSAPFHYYRDFRTTYWWMWLEEKWLSITGVVFITRERGHEESFMKIIESLNQKVKNKCYSNIFINLIFSLLFVFTMKDLSLGLFLEAFLCIFCLSVYVSVKSQCAWNACHHCSHVCT